MKAASLIAWLPIVTLPMAVVLFTPEDWPHWGFMWLFAWTLFVECKWLTWYAIPKADVSIARQLGYLVAWPGLDAANFFRTPNLRLPSLFEWLFAFSKFSMGVLLILIVFPRVPSAYDLVRGWIGMLGVVFFLHFGLFHLLSLGWQAIGVTAKPIMDWPIRSVSVSDFWGKRWNLAFRDLTHRFLFRPLTARFGAKVALVIGFVFSGILHELVISMPASAGWGGPTLFFLIQAVAILVERSTLGQRLGLTDGIRGWTFTMLVLLGPLFLLFHPPFVRVVVVPFLDWVGSLPRKDFL